MKNQIKESSFIQFHVFPCNINVSRPFKTVKERSFYDKKKEIILRTWTLHEREVHIKKKGEVYEFSDKGKVHIIDIWG